MTNRNQMSEWAAVEVLVLQGLSIDGHRLLEYDRKSALDDHGEVPGGSAVGGRG